MPEITKARSRIEALTTKKSSWFQGLLIYGLMGPSLFLIKPLATILIMHSMMNIRVKVMSKNPMTLTKSLSQSSVGLSMVSRIVLSMMIVKMNLSKYLCMFELLNLNRDFIKLDSLVVQFNPLRLKLGSFELTFSIILFTTSYFSSFSSPFVSGRDIFSES